MSQISIADAKNTLTKLIHEAEQGTAVQITRRGKPVAVLLSQDAYERLQISQKQQGFWAALQQWRVKASFEGPDLAHNEVDSWRDRDSGRDFSWRD